MDEIKSLNPQYKKNIIPGDSKPQTLRLPINYISTFIDSQDTIYAHRSAELFKNRRTVSVANTRSTARSSKGKVLHRATSPTTEYATGENPVDHRPQIWRHRQPDKKLERIEKHQNQCGKEAEDHGSFI